MTDSKQSNCTIHPEREAVGKCSNCGKLVCDECKVEHEGKVICPVCLDEKTGIKKTAISRSKRIGILAIVSVIVFILAFVFWEQSKWKSTGLEETSQLIDVAVNGNDRELKTLLKDYQKYINDGLPVNGWTALHWATYQGRNSAVAILLSHKADPNIQDKDKDTPLHVAAAWGRTSIAKLLIEHGADVNSKNRDGKTPLHAAVKYSHKKVITLLLNCKANANLADKDGKTPLDYSEEINAILRNHGAMTGAELEEEAKEMKNK